MRILVLDSSLPINTRNQRIIDTLATNFPKAEIRICAWDRDNGMNGDDDNYYIYHKLSPYGKPVRKLRNLYGYYRFIKKVYKHFNPQIVIASHWDMLLFASKLKTRGQLLIYENLDIPTSANSKILKLLQRIERRSMRKTDAIIFASRFFAPLYDYSDAKKFTVENKIVFKTEQNPFTYHPADSGLKIGFLGCVRYIEILKNLVDAVREIAGIELVIHGDGPDKEELELYSQGMPNISFTGRYDYNNISRLYADIDIIWAVYPSKDFNVQYAISNKFNESVFFGIPCIYSTGTKLGDMVDKERIGFTIDGYSVVDITRLLLEINSNKGKLCQASENLLEMKKQDRTWDEEITPFINYLRKYENNSN